MRRLVAIGVVVLLLSGVSTAPAQAITFGQPDGNAHPYVGALVVEDSLGGRQRICSGTLVAPKIFLTAGHCFVLHGLPPNPVWVTFDQTVTLPGSKLWSGTYTVDPLYDIRPLSDYHDLAVVVLDEDPGITPAILPGVGVLDGPGVRDQTFTAVGYGQVRDDKTGGPHSLSPGGERRAVSQTFQSTTDTLVTFSKQPSTGNGGSCFGDSGGPHLWGDTPTIVAISTSGDTYCRSTDRDYRLDTAESLAFITSFIP
jgi:hypothetical protein